MKWTRSPWSVGDRLPPQRPHTMRAPETLMLASVRGRSTAPPSSVPTASPHSKHDSSTHLVRRIRAPRSTSLVDITTHPNWLPPRMAVRELPTVPRTLVPNATPHTSVHGPEYEYARIG